MQTKISLLPRDISTTFSSVKVIEVILALVTYD